MYYLNMQTSFAKEKKPYVVSNFNLGIDPGNYSTLLYTIYPTIALRSMLLREDGRILMGFWSL